MQILCLQQEIRYNRLLANDHRGNELLSLVVVLSRRHHCHAAGSGKFIILKVIIQGKECRFLLDCGSSDSFLAQQLVDSLNLDTAKKPSGYKNKVRFSDGSTISSDFRVENLPWKSGRYESRQHFEVIPLELYDGILGIDWLARVDSRVNWRTRSISVKVNRRWMHLPTWKNPGPAPESNLCFLSFKDLRQAMQDEPRLPVFEVHLHKTTDQEHRSYTSLEAALPSLPEDYGTILMEHKEVFPDELPALLPSDDRIKHTIMLEPHARPFAGPVYRLSTLEQRDLHSQIQTLLQAGMIKPSSSPWASPVLLVAKKDGGLRLCIDYRRLNKSTIPDKYPVPLVDDLLDQLADAKFFTKLDLRSGYWQIAMDPSAVELTAFRTRFGHFAFRVMPFGLCNAGATFQRVMDKLLAPWIGICVVVYLDDILIYSSTWSSHLVDVAAVLQCLLESSFFAKVSKCDFAVTRVLYLGFLVGVGCVSVDTQKTERIKSWPIPQTVKDVRSFLGLCNFYRRFVPKYSEKAAPLTALTRSNIPWNWSPDAQSAFQTLKDSLTSKPVLRIPRFGDSLVVYTDASQIALGASLGVIVDDAVQPCAFTSRKLNHAESTYSTFHQELMAVDLALRSWRAYLLGSPFTIRTDNAGLLNMSTAPPPSDACARIYDRLQPYQFNIEHVPGAQNTVADALSRTTFPADPSPMFSTAQVVADKSWITTLRMAQQTDPKYRSFFLPDHQVPVPYVVSDNLLWHRTGNRSRLVIPAHPALRRRLLKAFHEDPLWGHPGQRKMFMSLSRLCYWPRLTNELPVFIRSCVVCAQTKDSRRHPIGNPQQMPTPRSPWSIVHCDFLSGLPVSTKGFSSFVLFIDRFSKMVVVVPTPDEFPATAVIQVINDFIFRAHGIPKILITDRDTRYDAQVWQDFLHTNGIEQRKSSPYYPPSDGQAERANGVILQYLRAFCFAQQQRWDVMLPLAELAFNSTIHKATGFSPLFLCSGSDSIPLCFRSVSDSAPTTNVTVPQHVHERQAAWQSARRLLLQS